MLTLSFTASSLGMEHLAGATLGAAHLRRHGDHWTALSAMQDEAVLLLDFQGITSVTASYLKASALTVLRAAQSATEDGADAHGFDTLPALHVFPMLVNLSDEVRDEAREVLRSQNLVMLEALDWDMAHVTKARLLGQPERAVEETLRYLKREGRATAGTLYEKYGQPRGAVTAFNNRLAELYRLRLARRSRQGRQWMYWPISTEVTRG